MQFLKYVLFGLFFHMSSTHANSGIPSIEEILVTISTREETDLSSLAASVSQIDGENLRLLQQGHIQEAMLRVAGANLQRGNGQEYLPAIRSPVLTGAGACGAILTMEENIPLRPSGFCNINELFEAHSEAAHSIEVQRGPGTVFYGSNAQHGLINVRVIEPTDDSGRLLLEAGPQAYARAKLALLGEEKGLKTTLTHQGGYREDSGFDQQKLTAWTRESKEKFDFSAGLTMVNLNQETAGYINGLDAYKNSELVKSNPTPEAFRDAVATRIWSRFSVERDTGSLLVVAPYARYSRMDFLQHFLPGDPLEENGQSSVGVQTAFHAKLGEDGELQIASGIDVELTQAFLTQSQDSPTLGSAFLQETVPEGTHYDYEVDAQMFAGFVQANWQTTDRLGVIAGLRMEYLGYDYDNLMLAGRTREDGTECGFGGCRYSRPDDRDDSFTNLSPKLGFIYNLSGSHQLSLSLARGFRAPQATELYRLQRDQIVADLDTEQLTSLDLGLRADLERVSYGLSFYYMEKQNYIFRDSDFFNVSDGETDHRGLELELDYAFTDRLDLGINASFTRHRYTHQQFLNDIDIFGNEIDSAPGHFGSARLGWNYSEAGRAELEWVHMGDYFLDPENQHVYPGHDLFNLRVNHQLSSNWQMSARLLNLTDSLYAERADYTSFTEERYFPGQPRSLYITVAINW